ncbi:MAG TPA: glycine cleavage system aminomethyltransferase GcvT [Vicinamibacterales bacterium]|jgi:aminomethyltransferase|nr:glycine cleavage system aminomethyltransferase GcvT [Vicinamibacterales bacterium]
MTDTAAAPLKKTPLHARHRASDARMVPFAGWDMPVEYSGVANEHMAVRTRAGLFDVSHMGELEIAGRNALAAVQRISSNDASRLQVGQAHYSALTTPEGTFVDDMLVYRMAPNHFMLVVNASNIVKDYQWIASQIADMGEVAVVDASSRYALIAIQGPAAREVLKPLTGVDLDEIKYYWFASGEVASALATISRTGYTGEDGFEIFCRPNQADQVWRAVMESGRSADVIPCGLAARDTLRLEAAMRLYGNDIDETTSVLEADLGWIVGWKKDRFIGHERLREQKERGVGRKLVGFELIDRGIARHGYPVVRNGERIGIVTSGTQTPYVKKAIGMAYLPTALTEPGTEFDIDVRGRASRAKVVPLPFYKRAK